MTHDQRNQAIKELIRARTEAMTSSPETARRMLIEEGIYTRKGNLRAEFGGKAKKASA